MRPSVMTVCALLSLVGCKRREEVVHDDIARPVDTAESAGPSAVAPKKLVIGVTNARCINGSLVAAIDAPAPASASASASASAAASPSGLGMSGVGGLGTAGEGIGLGTIGGFGALGSPTTTGTGLGYGWPRGMMLKGQTLAVEGLAREDTEKTICAGLSTLSPCIDAATTAEKDLDGTLGIAWTLGDDGHGTSKIVGGTLVDEKLQACVADAASKIAFPPPAAKSGTVTYAIDVHRPKKPFSAKVVESGASLTGRLPIEVIKRIVRANTPRLRLCYQAALKTDPKLKGTVVTRFVIDTTGAVESASTAPGTLGNASVEKCVLGVFRSLAFPAPEAGKVSVTYPISFDNVP